MASHVQMLKDLASASARSASGSSIGIATTTPTSNNPRPRDLAESLSSSAKTNIILSTDQTTAACIAARAATNEKPNALRQYPVSSASVAKHADAVATNISPLMSVT